MSLLNHHVSAAEYVAGQVPARRREAMEAHLSRCAHCRSLVAGYRRRERRRLALPEETAAVDTGPQALVGTRRRALSNAVPIVGSLLTVIAFVGVLVAAWNAGGAEDTEVVSAPEAEFSAAGVALSSYQVSDLRRSGWACPDLRPLGLEMTSSTGYRSGDTASVTMTFSGDGKAVVLSETRQVGASGAGLDSPTPEAAASVEPTLQAETTGLKEAAGDAVRFTAPDGGRYVVHSSLDKEHTSALVSRLQDLSQDRVEDARAAAVGGWARLTRGWARLVDPTR